MELKDRCSIDIPSGLLDAIRSFPVEREVEHCGIRTKVSPFDFYAECPECGARIKVRSFSGIEEIEDLFDAVFEWMNRPMAQEMARHRLAELAAETDDEEAEANETKAVAGVTTTTPSA